MFSNTRPSSEWSTLATFNWLQEALLLRARLEGAGIAAQIPEEHTASINPWATAMQVHVLVHTSELERAREVLELPRDESKTGDEEACPKCGGKAFELTGRPVRNFVYVLAALMVGVPVRKAEVRRCRGCGAVA